MFLWSLGPRVSGDHGHRGKLPVLQPHCLQLALNRGTSPEAVFSHVLLFVLKNPQEDAERSSVHGRQKFFEYSSSVF